MDGLLPSTCALVPSPHVSQLPEMRLCARCGCHDIHGRDAGDLVMNNGETLNCLLPLRVCFIWGVTCWSTRETQDSFECSSAAAFYTALGAGSGTPIKSFIHPPRLMEKEVEKKNRPSNPIPNGPSFAQLIPTSSCWWWSVFVPFINQTGRSHSPVCSTVPLILSGREVINSRKINNSFQDPMMPLFSAPPLQRFASDYGWSFYKNSLGDLNFMPRDGSTN